MKVKPAVSRPISRSITAALFCVLAVACAPALCAQNSSESDMAFLANWVIDLQFHNSSQPSFGAIKVHNTVSAVGADGKPYYRVSPYIANLGVLGLVNTHQPRRLQTAERWITWYLTHLDARGAPDGVPYEHFYLADGSGETTCVKPGDPNLCRYNDATDSAAATFCAVVWAYLQSGGKAEIINTAARKKRIESLGSTMLSLQQPDGLCWAKQDYRAKYLEDNCEVYEGFSALARLEQAVYKDTHRANSYSAAAMRVRSGILTDLYDLSSGLYSIAKFEDGSRSAANLTKWYPDTQAQVWPQLFGVVPPSNPKVRAVARTIDSHWNGKDSLDWTASPERVNGGWINADFAYGMLLAGSKARVSAYLKAVKRVKFTATTSVTGPAWPFTVADAGWLLRSLEQTGKRGFADKKQN